MPANLDLFRCAKNGFFKGNGEVFAQIISTLRTTAASSGTGGSAKDISKDVTKDPVQINGGLEASESATAAVHGRMAKAVIGSSLVDVRQNSVCLTRFFELFFRFRISGVPIRVVLHRELPVGRLQLNLGAVTTDSQDLVIVT